MVLDSLYDILEIIVLIMLIFLTILSVISSTNWGEDKLVLLGKWLRFLPRWNFFAPIPGTSDYYVLYREQYSSGSWSNWQELRIQDFSAPIYPPFWNPHKLQKKAFFDIIQSLSNMTIETSNTNEEDTLKISIPYLLILNKVANETHSIYCENIQFLIMEGNSVDMEFNPIFVSGVHSI